MVTRLFFSSEEEGYYYGVIKLMDPDGREILRSPIDLNVPIFEEEGTGIYMDAVGEVKATIETFGEFQFRVEGFEGDVQIFPFYIFQKKTVEGSRRNRPQ